MKKPDCDKIKPVSNVVIDTRESYTGRTNNSKLSYVDCCMRLMGDYSFSEMTNDDLDCLYRVAFGRWPYHMTKDAMVFYLEDYRRAVKEKNNENNKTNL